MQRLTVPLLAVVGVDHDFLQRRLILAYKQRVGQVQELSPPVLVAVPGLQIRHGVAVKALSARIGQGRGDQKTPATGLELGHLDAEQGGVAPGFQAVSPLSSIYMDMSWNWNGRC